MKIIGLTGNIGSGKSEIAKIFSALNCKIIDLDKIGHQVLEQPGIRKKIIKLFGPQIIANKKISRSKLRSIVFLKKQYLDLFNKIMHPEMINILKKELKKYKKSRSKTIVVDAALIFEMKLQKMFDCIITVTSYKLISFLRTGLSRRLSYSNFNKIYHSQLPVKYKKQRSDYIIHNNWPIKLNKIFLKNRILKILDH